MKIAASILSIKDNIKEKVKVLEKTNIDYLHIDIMDGEFVPHETYSISYITDILDGIKKPLDVHLMVNDVNRYIDDFATLKPNYITFHYEAVDNHIEIIDYIKTKNIKVGISIKPNTSLDTLKEYYNEIDLILIMSVEPGAGGQLFIESITEKIKRLNEIRKENNYKFIIEVDGGINSKTINSCRDADMVVVGSYITDSDNYELQVNKLRLELN